MALYQPGYEVETTGYRMGAIPYQIRTLLDRRQFSDPDGCAERAGISSASWPIFGVVWPSGLALADEMYRFPIEGKRILEVGCGIGLPSLVLQQRGANITASVPPSAGGRVPATHYRPERPRADTLGMQARVVRVDSSKEEGTSEILEAAFSLPITVHADYVREVKGVA